MQVTRAGVDRSTNYNDEEITSIEVAKTAWDGEVGQGSIPIPDPAGNQEPYEGEQLLLEQSSETILDGFVGPTRTERGGSVTGTRRLHTHTLADDNALLQGHATPGWSRPAESPAARWAAFVRDFLPGSIDTTYLLTTHESGITLPKNVYRTDSLFDDLLADTVRPTGKTVYIEARRFHWHLPTEGQTCSLVIHDTNAISSTSFQPYNPSRNKDGMDLRNRIYARNDKGVRVTVSDATSISRHDSGGMRHQGFSEYGTDSAADMSRDIAVTLAERKDERVTWTYDIGPMTAAQAVALIPGSQMTVTAAIHGLSGSTKRIASVTLRYRHGRDSRHFMATVELGFPKRFRRKPTKTSSNVDSGGGSGLGSNDCGCPPLGTRCTLNFSLPSTSGMGPNILGSDRWSADSGVTVSGGEAHIPTGNNPYIGIAGAQPCELLVKQRLTRGTIGPSVATDPDVAARLTFLPVSISNLGLVYVDLELRMDHGNHGGVLAAELYFLLRSDQLPLGGTAPVLVAATLPSVIWTRIRFEEDPAHPGPTGQSIVSAKAWSDAVSEPTSWQVTGGAGYLHSGVSGPWSPMALLVLDNRAGATDTIWHIDSMEFIEGIPCGDPVTGMDVPWTKVGNGDGSTVTFPTPDPFMAGTLEARVDAHPVSVTEGVQQGTLGFAPVTSESVYYRYRSA